MANSAVLWSQQEPGLERQGYVFLGGTRRAGIPCSQTQGTAETLDRAEILNNGRRRQSYLAPVSA
ncbi:hypothetical protein GCM10027589_37510 [Actinocorallia lasiicapitis]